MSLIKYWINCSLVTFACSVKLANNRNSVSVVVYGLVST